MEGVYISMEGIQRQVRQRLEGITVFYTEVRGVKQRTHTCPGLKITRKENSELTERRQSRETSGATLPSSGWEQSMQCLPEHPMTRGLTES